MSCWSGLQKLAYNMFCSSKPAAYPHVLPRQCASSCTKHKPQDAALLSTGAALGA